MTAEYDEIGIWSEVKLAIVREYAAAYSKIMEGMASGQDQPPELDLHRRVRRAGIPRLQSDRRARRRKPGDRDEHRARLSRVPFHRYRTRPIRAVARHRRGPQERHTYTEDCNTVLLRDVFPRAKHSDYRRALCLLDPYNIDLTWDVIEAAGKSGSVEMFLNFMIMDINRNALRKRVEKSLQSKVDQTHPARRG